MHNDLLFNHFRGLTAQDIHAQGNFNILEIEFNAPPAAVEFREGRCRKSPVVGQCGGDSDGLASKSGNIHGKRDVAQIQDAGDGSP